MNTYPLLGDLAQLLETPDGIHGLLDNLQGLCGFHLSQVRGGGRRVTVNCGHPLHEGVRDKTWLLLHRKLLLQDVAKHSIYMADVNADYISLEVLAKAEKEIKDLTLRRYKWG